VSVWGLARLARLDARTSGTLLLVVPLANTSFLGFPAVEALLGADHLPAAVVYDQLGSFLALATYGAVVAAATATRPPGPGGHGPAGGDLPALRGGGRRRRC
jgi:malate permease and related proteins